jgi:hypothetical protein
MELSNGALIHDPTNRQVPVVDQAITKQVTHPEPRRHQCAPRSGHGDRHEGDTGQG